MRFTSGIVGLSNPQILSSSAPHFCSSPALRPTRAERPNPATGFGAGRLRAGGMEDPMGGGGGELRSEVPGRAMWADGQHTEGSRLRAKGLSRALAKALLLCVTASSLIGGEREALADTLTIESLSQPAPLSSSAEPGPSPSSPQSPNPMEIIHSVSNPHMPHMPSLHLSTSPPHDPSAPQHAGAPAPHKHSGHKPAHTLNWSQLSEEEKAAAKELGYFTPRVCGHDSGLGGSKLR